MTTLHKHKRNKKFIDRKVQGSLALRIVAYWFSCLISVCFILAFWTASARRSTPTVTFSRGSGTRFDQHFLVR